MASFSHPVRSQARTQAYMFASTFKTYAFETPVTFVFCPVHGALFLSSIFPPVFLKSSF